MNNFISVIDGFRTKTVYYQDTDSLYIEKKHKDKLNEAGLVDKNLCQGENDYGKSCIFFNLFLAPKMKFSSTLDEYAIFEGHKTFKGFSDVNGLLETKQ